MKTILTIILVSCVTVLFSQSDSTKNYFKKIAYGNEFTDGSMYLKKWNRDVKIFVLGQKDAEMESELLKVVKELNDLINTINISVVTNKEDANMIVFFGSKQEFNNFDPSLKTYVENNEGLFKIKHNTSDIYFGEMYVNTKGNLTSNQKKHLLREELTQSLGLCNDSYRYSKSIFYQGWTDTTEYAEIDKEIIKMLYNN